MSHVGPAQKEYQTPKFRLATQTKKNCHQNIIKGNKTGRGRGGGNARSGNTNKKLEQDENFITKTSLVLTKPLCTTRPSKCDR